MAQVIIRQPHHEGLGSILGPIWDVVERNGTGTGFSPFIIIPQMCHTHSIIYHQCCVTSAVDSILKQHNNRGQSPSDKFK